MWTAFVILKSCPNHPIWSPCMGPVMQFFGWVDNLCNFCGYVDILTAGNVNVDMGTLHRLKNVHKSTNLNVTLGLLLVSNAGL
jgi:hypothetical protein